MVVCGHDALLLTGSARVAVERLERADFRKAGPWFREYIGDWLGFVIFCSNKRLPITGLLARKSEMTADPRGSGGRSLAKSGSALAQSGSEQSLIIEGIIVA